MRSLRTRFLLMLPLAAMSVPALAQHRGGTCDALICDLTTAAVLAALLVVFGVSLAASIKHRGWIKGVISHGGVQVAFGYVALLAVCAALVFGALAFFGKV